MKSMIFQFDRKGAIAVLIVIFLSVQAIGLLSAQKYLGYIERGELEPAMKNPDSIDNSVILFAIILGMTVLIILMIRFARFMIRIIEAVSIFFTSGISFGLLLSYVMPLGTADSLSVGLALGLTAWKMLKPTHFSQNIALIFSVSGAGAVMGVSFGIIPVMVFMLLLSIYDFISVFITKHMVYMAKALTDKPTAFTAAIPTKTAHYEHVFQLGGGDIVIPLMFAVSVLARYGLVQSLGAIAGAFIAAIALFWHVTKNPGRALPALPPICAGSVIGFIIALMVF
ncbi:MAG: presenilin family intramembrane aspartyl protease [Candidatus Micrarchaeota archaeon]